MAGEEAALSTPPVQVRCCTMLCSIVHDLLSFLKAALRKVIAAGKKNGVPCGIPCGNAEQVRVLQLMLLKT